MPSQPGGPGPVGNDRRPGRSHHASCLIFPRLNILSYYLFTFGGLILLASFLTLGGAPGFGWYAYAPLTSPVHSPGVGGDMWIMGLVLSGLGTINWIVHPGCLHADLPL
jgi:heme/copper-type cytochrome/quinol oxidase subunit 1